MKDSPVTKDEPPDGWTEVVLDVSRQTRTIVVEGTLTIRYLTDRFEEQADAFIDKLSRDFSVRKRPMEVSR